MIQSGEQLQPLLNLMRDKLLDYPVLHCDETRLQVLHEPGRAPSAQSWMWVQSSGPPDKPVILFDYTASRAQEVPLRLLDGYRGYLMTDDYAGYGVLGELVVQADRASVAQELGGDPARAMAAPGTRCNASCWTGCASCSRNS